MHARGDLIGRRGDRVGDRTVEGAQLLVRERCSLLDPRQCGDLRGLQTLAGDGEVLHRSLGLRPVQGVHGNPHFAHGVVLDAVLDFGHCCSSRCDVGPSGRDLGARVDREPHGDDGHGRALAESVVGAHDAQSAVGDGLADELG